MNKIEITFYNYAVLKDGKEAKDGKDVDIFKVGSVKGARSWARSIRAHEKTLNHKKLSTFRINGREYDPDEQGERKLYSVTVTRTESTTVEVEASSEEEAQQEAYAQAIEGDDGEQVWETLSIDTSIETQGEEEKDDEDEEEAV